MVKQEIKGVGDNQKRPISAVLRDKFWLLVIALVIVAVAFVALALAFGWHMQRTIS